MKSVELLKFSESQSLVQIFKDNGEHKEYCVCSHYDPNAKEGSKWDWGHYFVDMEGALQYIATRCFSPIHRYVLIETDANNNIEEQVFDTYTEARKEFDAKFYDYAAYDDCHHSKVFNDVNENIVGELWFFDEPDIELKLIEITV